MVQLRKSRKNSAIFLVPSMITVVSMCSGFYAMVQAIYGNLSVACVAVFISMVLDGLDGRIARITKTSSSFGAELDSLADMVAFGVAPAVISFLWYANQYNRSIGLVASFIYCACVALRLARFNSNNSDVDKLFFCGLPSPAAAGLVIGYIYLVNEYKNDYSWLLSSEVMLGGVIILLVTALSMVSNVKFYSFREFNLYKKSPFRTLLVALFLLIMVLNFPDITTYGFFIAYLLFSYAMWILRIKYK